MSGNIFNPIFKNCSCKGSAGIVSGTKTSGKVFAPIPADYTKVPFDIAIDSTNKSVFEYNVGQDSALLKKNGNYILQNTITIESLANSERLIHFRIVDSNTGVILLYRALPVEVKSGDINTITITGLLTIGVGEAPSAPLTAHMEIKEEEQDYNLIGFESMQHIGVC